MDFTSYPKAVKRPGFGQIFCAAGNFFEKNRSKKPFLGTFWKILTRAFFGARSPSKLVYIGAHIWIS